MSRRNFLAALSGAAALSLTSLASAASGYSREKLKDYVDLSTFRPHPKTTVKRLVFGQPRPYWMGWPGSSYDLDERAAHFERNFSDAAQGVGVHLDATEKTVVNPDGLVSVLSKIVAEKPDALLVRMEHFDCWKWINPLASLHIPIIVFSPLGMGLLVDMSSFLNRRGLYVISALDAAGVEPALRMVRAKRQFEETHLLVVGRDVFSPELEAEVGKSSSSLLNTGRRVARFNALGTKVHYAPREILPQLFTAMPVTDEVHEVAKGMAEHCRKIVEPTKQDLLNAARAFTSAKRLLQDEGCNAITTDCLGMVSAQQVPTPPCMAASLFQDSGVTYGCEADVYGALSLMLPSYMLDKPGFMSNPVPDTVRNLHIATHCVSGTRLDGFSGDAAPYILRSHAESNLGVSPQVMWRDQQQVTVARFLHPNSLMLFAGTVAGNVTAPHSGGCRTTIEIALDGVRDVREVTGHHHVVFYGDHRREIRSFCQLYGMDVVTPGATT